MQKKLSALDYVFISSLLFGLFFGAGNLIFPIQLGQAAGSAFVPATLGLLTTAVGLPFLGIVAMGVAKKESLLELASKVGPFFGLWYTVALYLTIGPFFAIPRTATVSFEAAFAPYIAAESRTLFLFGFSILFFGGSLFFTLRPTNILTWIGKVLNPLFLSSLLIVAVVSFVNPMGNPADVPVQDSFQSGAFFAGFLEGYNTMDALASLAFGIVIIHALKRLGVTKPSELAKSTLFAGIFSMSLMAVIYAVLVYIGVTSQGIMDISENGGVALAAIAKHYFGAFGAVVLAVIITAACFKTAVGLLTAISEMFVHLFPRSFSYQTYVYLFTSISLLVANLGLSQIILVSIPVLMFLYPLAIVLILVAMASPLFEDQSVVYQWGIGFTLPFAVLDFLTALPSQVIQAIGIQNLLATLREMIPFADLGLGWAVPAAIGIGIGVVLRKRK